jgi:hypothetical protein
MIFRKRKKDANQAQIVRALEKIGVVVIDLSGVGAGVSDLLCAFRGMFIGVEVKNLDGRGKRLTKAQVDMHAKLRSAGVWIYTVTSVDEALDVFRIHSGLGHG